MIPLYTIFSPSVSTGRYRNLTVFWNDQTVCLPRQRGVSSEYSKHSSPQHDGIGIVSSLVAAAQNGSWAHTAIMISVQMTCPGYIQPDDIPISNTRNRAFFCHYVPTVSSGWVRHIILQAACAIRIAFSRLAPPPYCLLHCTTHIKCNTISDRGITCNVTIRSLCWLTKTTHHADDRWW